MRVGLLDGAWKSYREAKRLMGGKSNKQLKGNMAAMKGHEEFADSIGHDRYVL